MDGASSKVSERLIMLPDQTVSDIMTKDFEAEEQGGVVWFKWKNAKIEGIVLPIVKQKASDTSGGFEVSPAGIGGGADKKKAWSGESVAIIFEDGKATPYHIWEQRKELESGLSNTAHVSTAVVSVITHNGSYPEFASVQPSFKLKKFESEKGNTQS